MGSVRVGGEVPLKVRYLILIREQGAEPFQAGVIKIGAIRTFLHTIYIMAVSRE